jgi:hypothetical protein
MVCKKLMIFDGLRNFRRKDGWAYRAYLVCCLVQGVGVEYSFWFVRFDADNQSWLYINLTGNRTRKR